MPLMFCCVGAGMAAPALGKEKDNRQERKLRHRAEKGELSFSQGKNKGSTLNICNIPGQGLPCLNPVLWGDPPAHVCWLPLKEREETPSLFLIKLQNTSFVWARFRHSINACRFPCSGQQSLRNTEMGFLCRELRDELTEQSCWMLLSLLDAFLWHEAEFPSSSGLHMFS